MGQKLEEMLGEIHLLSRNGNFAADDEADQNYHTRKNGDAVEYFETMAYGEMEAEVWKTRVLRGTRKVYSRTTHRSGKKRNRQTLWAGRNSKPKSGSGLPDRRIADRLNRITNKDGKPSRRLRRYNGYRAEYGQKIFMKRLQQSLAEINEVLAE